MVENGVRHWKVQLVGSEGGAVQEGNFDDADSSGVPDCLGQLLHWNDRRVLLFKAVSTTNSEGHPSTLGPGSDPHTAMMATFAKLAR